MTALLNAQGRTTRGMWRLAAAPLVAGLLLTGCGTATDPDAGGETPSPVTQQPAPEDSAEPTSEEPTSEDPAAAEPTSEEPTSEEPSTEDPAAAEPTSEDPAAAEPTSEEPSSEEPTSEEPTDEPSSEAPAAGEADGALTLTVDSIEGLPVDAPVDDLVAAVQAELGEPEANFKVATKCIGGADADLWAWHGFELMVPDDPAEGTLWHVDERLTGADLPDGLALGTEEAEVLAERQVAEESITGGGRPVLLLEDGYAVTLDPQSRVVVEVANRHLPPC